LSVRYRLKLRLIIKSLLLLFSRKEDSSVLYEVQRPRHRRAIGYKPIRSHDAGATIFTGPTMHSPTPPPAWPLAAELDLAAADGLLGDMQRRIGVRDPIRMDGSAVERISTACLQVLAAAAIAARAGGVPFETVAPSAVLRDAIVDVGLGGLLGGASA
jgi:anti-anti-sigma regulatory factor